MQRKQGGKLTEPILPAKIIATGGGVTIEHYYRSNDHEPAHLHVVGGGQKTRIGQMGKVIFAGDPEPSPSQRKLIDAHKAAIRRAVKKIGRWLWFHEQEDTMEE